MPTTTKPNTRVFTTPRASAAAINTPAANIAAPRVPAAHPQECCCPACVGLECLDRTRFFSGQLLTEADLNNEQSYWLAKGRLHNRLLHGWGVVCGMQVVCSECDGWVTVKPGYAIDPCGNDIIVCSEQAFNVIKAIQACCIPTKPTGKCSPLRSAPPANCQDALQTWCITIEYEEQASRMVAPLKQATPKSGSCSCGSTKGGCGCGCGGGAKNGNGSSHGSSVKCSCSVPTQTTTAVPTGACEPTRINEGFRLCVVPAPQNTFGTQTPAGPALGTFAAQFALCFQPLSTLLQQKPVLSTATDPLSEQQDYQIVCNYLRSVQNALAQASITHCQYDTFINSIQVPTPPVQDNGAYLASLNAFLTEISAILQLAVLDCLCISLVPPCPSDPCDDRLILACVTVQNGKIINICHFGGGRKQVLTFPVLYYWLSIIGFDKALAALQNFLELICCGEDRLRQGLFGANVSQKNVFTTAGVSNAAAVNQMMTAFAAQNLGASVINAAAPNARTVDLRPLVGLNTDVVTRALESYQINPQSIAMATVDADPAWTDDAVAASPQFAPAAFSVTGNLTVYTKGKMVVGFEVTDPVTVLSNQVQKLQQQVNQLTGGNASARESADESAKKESPKESPRGHTRKKR
jgi:hypothetical protein